MAVLAGLAVDVVDAGAATEGLGCGRYSAPFCPQLASNPAARTRSQAKVLLRCMGERSREGIHEVYGVVMACRCRASIRIIALARAGIGAVHEILVAREATSRKSAPQVSYPPIAVRTPRHPVSHNPLVGVA